MEVSGAHGVVALFVQFNEPLVREGKPYLIRKEPLDVRNAHVPIVRLDGGIPLPCLLKSKSLADQVARWAAGRASRAQRLEGGGASPLGDRQRGRIRCWSRSILRL
jgi:hypothetical protein